MHLLQNFLKGEETGDGMALIDEDRCSQHNLEIGPGGRG